MEKIKQFVDSEAGKDILTVLIVILVGLGSFELGRLSKSSDNEGLKVEYQQGETEGVETAANALNALESISGAHKTSSAGSISGSFFGSSRGTKYYSLGCSAGKTIKQENRVYFQSGEEAQAAGYTLSTSCR